MGLLDGTRLILSAQGTLPVCRPGRARGVDCAQQGFTMIEVLISIILLSIGVLGMVGMQAWALRSNQQARFQGTAVQLSRDLGEMMRSNTAIAGIQASASDPYLIDDSAAPASPAGTAACYNAACSTLDLATADAQDWYARAYNSLPGIRVVVCYDSAPYDPTSGLPRWACTPSTTPGNDSPVIKIGWTTASTKAGEAAHLAVTPGVVVPVNLR